MGAAATGAPGEEARSSSTRTTPLSAAWVFGYHRRWLRGDLIAGLTVAAYAIPQVMAYASVAGLPPVVGLWALLAPALAYALAGSSRQLSVGPESTTALLTATAVAPLAAGDPVRYAVLAAALALVVAALCLLAWVFRLGVLANLFSRPVLLGYLAGVAVLMIVSQLGTVTGVAVDGDSPIAVVRSLLDQLEDVDPATLGIASVVLVVLLVMHRFADQWPGPLLVVLAATAVVAAFDLADRGVEVVGAIDGSLPSLSIPPVSWQDVGELLPAAIGVTVIAYTDNVLTARSFALARGEVIDVNREFAALGLANASAGVLQGMPVSSSGSRTAIGAASGSQTQLAHLVMAGVVLVVLVGAASILAQFPQAALGALVIYAALLLIDVPGFVRLLRFRRTEFLLAIATTVAVLTLDLLVGVAVAVGLSVLALLARVSHPHDGVLGLVPGLAGMHDVADYPDARLVPGLLVYRYDAPLFFGNAADFRHRALAAVAGAERDGHRVRWFLLNAEANVEVDITGLDALEEVRRALVEQGVVVALARVKQDLYVELAKVGLVDRIGRDHIFVTLPTAVAAFEAWETDRPSSDA